MSSPGVRIAKQNLASGVSKGHMIHGESAGCCSLPIQMKKHLAGHSLQPVGLLWNFRVHVANFSCGTNLMGGTTLVRVTRGGTRRSGGVGVHAYGVVT